LLQTGRFCGISFCDFSDFAFDLPKVKDPQNKTLAKYFSTNVFSFHGQTTLCFVFMQSCAGFWDDIALNELL